MRDPLEGDRPDEMHADGRRVPDGEPQPKRIHYVLGWILAAVFAVLFAKNLIEHLK